jgi:hypothetical protein
MIDHLMTFASEAAAQADPVVGKYWTAPDAQGDPGTWDASRVIPGVSVYTLNDDGSQTPYSGWFIVIAAAALDPNLEAEPGCILIADRDKANANDPSFMLYTQPGMSESELAASRVSPVFAGTTYPFGQP